MKLKILILLIFYCDYMSVCMCVRRGYNCENPFMVEIGLGTETPFKNFFFKLGNLLQCHSWLVKHRCEIMLLVFSGMW